MNYRNGKILRVVFLLCFSPLFNSVGEAQNAGASSSDASASSQSNVTVNAPGVSIAIDKFGVRMSSDGVSEPAMPPTPPERPWRAWKPRHFGNARNENAMVNIGDDSTLTEQQHADSVVSVLGSSTSAGVVSDSVVSIFGNTRVTGPVGDGAVAVLGNTYVNNVVGGDAVAVFGDVELGPKADVGGQVVAVGGTVIRDPAAIVRGGVQNVSFGPRAAHLMNFAWLRPWIDHCLKYGRLLAFAPGLGWAWSLALVSLALYVFSALLFRSGIEKCVDTLESHPGHSILAGLLTTLATPVLIVLLCITIIGILAIPFVGIGILIADSFGKLVMLAWIGRRLTPSAKEGTMAHPAFAVLVGGVIVTLLYVIPVVGFIVYKLLGFVGLGVVIYTLLLMARSRRETQHAVHAPHEPAVASSSAAAGDAAPESVGSTQADSASEQQTRDEAAPRAEPARTKTVSAVAAIAYPRAGFWPRMAALLLDLILISVILNFVFVGGRVHLLLLAVYGAAMWKLKGTTIGGIVFNLQVVRVDGCEIDWATAIVRALSCFLSLFVVGLGFIWIAFDADKQAWHDKIAGTVVVRLPKGVSLL